MVYGSREFKLRYTSPGAHRHCIKNAGLMIRTYASDNNDHYPYHTNGFGDALVLMVKENPIDAIFFTCGDDDGSLLRAAATNGTHMPEERCTRIYVQGLSDTNNPQIAMLFDRYAIRGGDHFRSPFKPYKREVACADGAMQVVLLENWPRFAREQIELLVKEGIPRARAEAYYAPTLRADAKR